MAIGKTNLGGRWGWTAALLVLVSSAEGLRTTAYIDPVGIPTICFGSTEGVKIGDEKSIRECELLLLTEVAEYASDIESLVNHEISNEEFAAYTSFAYNVGVNAFRQSTLLRKLNQGDRIGACNELPRWNKATKFGKKIILPGLVKRREEERLLCLSGLSQ